jgi:hypothetical protein
MARSGFSADDDEAQVLVEAEVGQQLRQHLGPVRDHADLDAEPAQFGQDLGHLLVEAIGRRVAEGRDQGLAGGPEAVLGHAEFGQDALVVGLEPGQAVAEVALPGVGEVLQGAGEDGRDVVRIGGIRTVRDGDLTEQGGPAHLLGEQGVAGVEEDGLDVVARHGIGDSTIVAIEWA